MSHLSKTDTTSNVLSQPALAREVASLASSLDVAVATPAGPYDPDAFIVAIRKQHDQLMDVQARLRAENAVQREREIALQTREAAVTFREKRMAAYERLSGLPNLPLMTRVRAYLSR